MLGGSCYRRRLLPPTPGLVPVPQSWASVLKRPRTGPRTHSKTWEPHYYEILHDTQNPFEVMSVDMLGAITPKDISICSVVQEIARQIDHFDSELVDFRLFSVWHSRVHYAATRTSFATIFDVSESSIHRLSFAVPFMSIVVAVAERSGGKVPSQTPSPSHQSKNSNARQNAASSIFDMKICVRKRFTLGLSHTSIRL